MRIYIPLSFAIAVAGCGGSSDNPTPEPPVPPPPSGQFGLDARPSNLTCVAPDRETGSIDVEIEREFESLSFSQPLAMLQAPGDSNRWFVLEKGGRVRVFADDPDTTSFLPDFIDLNAITNFSASGEGGLLGMGFHPDFEVNGEVFLSWTDSGSPLTSIIARFDVNAGGETLNAGSREDILRLEQDFSNHNGGNIAFGPDGHLYIGFGDGGSSGDPNSRAQETRNLLGAMLRIDVDGGTPYAIPPDNPFAGGAACPADPDMLTNNCPEIFAWGLRNPWRWTFDTATGDLWAGDVGQGSFEEIDLIELGGNYGWDCREGAHDFGSSAASCATATNLIDPVHEYPRSEGVSVTGGYVYRGAALPGLAGSYLFADFGSGRFWRLVDDGAGGLTDELLIDTSLAIASFGQGNDNELYLVDIGGGGLYKIVPGPFGSNPSPVPALLSDTGCMAATDASQPGSGLIPYTVTAPFWSDGADKTRWLAIPNGTDIELEADGDFTFPPGSILVKQFHLGGDLIETRVLMHHPDGVWTGYSYQWDDQLGDGVLAEGGAVENVQGQDWIFPSTAQCNVCHTAAAGNTLGLETLQLNGNATYPSTGRTANQLATLDDVFVLDGLVGDPSTLDSLVDPFDSAESLADRARSYLHTNCAQCHRPNGPAPSDLDLRFRATLAQTNACDAPPQNGDLGLGGAARIIAPGNAGQSVLVGRMSRRDVNGMPPLASSLVDSAGVALLESWIDGLNSCL
ncbi:MAG TPA: PQQ-dependent sugar dehydrogenase [Gammaproteobacteria bacterium]|nr:PQQ-dependent sugar dehydrogenase [Gammaproteobacteria bacterium]